MATIFDGVRTLLNDKAIGDDERILAKFGERFKVVN